MKNCEKSVLDATCLLKVRWCNPDELSRECIVEVETNMPAPGPAPLASILLPGEHKDIRVDVQDLLINADDWLDTPNVKFSGRSPQDLIGTRDEQLLRDTLRSALYSGME